MIERVNSSVNVLSLLIILTGGLIAVWRPEVGKELIVGGLGVFGGGTLAKSQSPN